MKQYLSIFLSAASVTSVILFANSVLTTLILLLTIAYWIRQHRALSKAQNPTPKVDSILGATTDGSTASPTDSKPQK